jgi:hypothetical protein
LLRISGLEASPHAGVAKPGAIKHALQGYRSRCLAALGLTTQPRK